MTCENDRSCDCLTLLLRRKVITLRDSPFVQIRTRIDAQETCLYLSFALRSELPKRGTLRRFPSNIPAFSEAVL